MISCIQSWQWPYQFSRNPLMIFATYLVQLKFFNEIIPLKLRCQNQAAKIEHTILSAKSFHLNLVS